jgi:uncharacterized protein (DUF2384 family)
MGKKKEVVNLAIKVIGSKEGAEAWMKTPQVALNNKKPIDCLNNKKNVKELLCMINLLNAMEMG